MSESSPFRPSLVIGLIVAGLISFGAFVALLGWGGEAGGRSGGRGTALSVAAIGFKGLVDLTGEFHRAEMIRDEAGLGTEELVVVALEPSTEQRHVERLLIRREGLPTVLILPKWAVRPDRQRRGWVRSIGPFLGPESERLLPGDLEVRLVGRSGRGARGAGQDMLRGLSVPAPAAAQIIDGAAIETLVGLTGDGALVARLGDEPHYVVADPDLLNNHGLRDPARARAAVQLLTLLMPSPQGTVHFDLTINGYGSGRSILRSMFEPPFLAMTLALIAAALLAGFHGASRFGPARRPARAIPFGKAALVENSAGLVRIAKREVSLGGGYADVVRDDAARAGAAPPNLRDAELEAYLDRFSPSDREPFSVLAGRLRFARDRAELVAAARALFRWKKELIR